jgi:hypothetical protein
VGEHTTEARGKSKPGQCAPVDFDTAAYSIDGCAAADFDTAAYSIDGCAAADFDTAAYSISGGALCWQADEFRRWNLAAV